MIYPECTQSFLLFVDGCFCPSQSCCPKEIVVADGQITLPAGTTCETPLQIISHSEKSEALQLFIGQDSSLKVICSSHVTFDFQLKERAFLELTQLSRMESLSATLQSASRFKSVHMIQGGSTDYRVILAGEHATVELAGLSFLKDSHTTVFIDHQKPHTHSNQTFKGVLDGVNRSSFAGKIIIRKEAQKSQAYQKNHNLLLSDTARAISKPHLEIFADDVKASHGATVGQLNEEHLFYLKSRGLSHERARNLQIFGFVQEITKQIPLITAQKEINEVVYRS
ncbi:MAG: FeS cluster assembly protein SufD [Chlamydiae bacterium]|nr:FeS cluster assembly protein SufD [Chlamydiota bacterium]